MSRAIADIAFSELLPGSIAADPRVAAAAQVLDVELKAAASLVDNVLIWSRIDELSEPLLSYLAWQLHVDYWRPDMVLAEKRAMLQQAFILHQTKGTPGAIENAMAAAVQSVGGARVEEWFEYGGTPYHFRVVVDIVGELAGGDLTAELMRIVAAYKNERSELDGVEYNLSVLDLVPVFSGAVYGEEIISAYPGGVAPPAGETHNLLFNGDTLTFNGDNLTFNPQ